jgi:hypothetical protein
MTTTGRPLLRDIGLLLRSTPDHTATPAERAAWFDRKAGVLDAIATDPNHPDPSARELATAARAEATRIRRGGEPR